MKIPSYLVSYSGEYSRSPIKAAIQWFREARFGMFIHYGLYSLLGRAEWVQYYEKIPVSQYAKLMDRFSAENFDAKTYADLAVKAGMKYITFTTRHHDSFCLFDTAETEFNSVNAPNCRRDLVAELAKACESRGLGLCLYYSHGRDWRHPHAPNNDQFGGHARPKYDSPEPSYAQGDDHDLNQYVEFMLKQIRELLTQYGPIASIWLDGIGVPLAPKDKHGKIMSNYIPKLDGDPFRCQELYDLIHDLQPQCLVSYKQGYLHTEDYYAPERESVTGKEKIIEICETMMPESWGHDVRCEGKHKNVDEVWDVLEKAITQGCNLLLNTGPFGDGKIHPNDHLVFCEIGHRISKNGFPLNKCNLDHVMTNG